MGTQMTSHGSRQRWQTARCLVYMIVWWRVTMETMKTDDGGVCTVWWGSVSIKGSVSSVLASCSVIIQLHHTASPCSVTILLLITVPSPNLVVLPRQLHDIHLIVFNPLTIFLVLPRCMQFYKSVFFRHVWCSAKHHDLCAVLERGMQGIPPALPIFVPISSSTLSTVGMSHEHGCTHITVYKINILAHISCASLVCHEHTSTIRDVDITNDTTGARIASTIVVYLKDRRHRRKERY